MSISKRLNELVSFEGISPRAVALKIGVSPQRFGNYLAGRDPDYETLRRIIETYVDISPEWIMTGHGNMLRDEAAQSLYKITSTHPLRTDRRVDLQCVPLYNLEATAGFVQLLADPARYEPQDLICIPDLPPCDGGVYVRGDSMYPILKNGDIVLYKQIHDLQNNIFFGEMYLIAYDMYGEDYVMVKYVQKSEDADHIKLVSYNTHHAPKDIPIDRIRAMALVKASVRYNTMG